MERTRDRTVRSSQSWLSRARYTKSTSVQRSAMANPFVRILLVSILLIASTGRADDVTDMTSEMPMSTTSTSMEEVSAAQTTPAPSASSNAPSVTELVTNISPQETPAITTAGFSSSVPVDDVTVTPSSAPVVPVDGSSSLTVNVSEGTTTTTATTAATENNSSSTFTFEITTTASPATNPEAEMSSTTTTTIPPALSSTTTTTTTETVTTPPIVAETTTVEKRSTTSSAVYHECVTSVPCIDPNSHCVNIGGLNTCQCRIGFRKTPGGLCLVIPFTAAVTTSSTTTTSTPETSTHPIIPTAAPAPIPKREMAKQASELTQDEKLDVVTIGLLPVSSVVEWLLVQDIHFRTAIAKVLTSTNFTHPGEEKPKTVNVSADQIVYVAPSPQMTNDGLLVAFLVKDNEGVSPGHRFPQGGIIARHRREGENSINPPTGYFPSAWIIGAIREHECILETHLNQNISLIYGGVAPSLLYSTDQIASASLFERRLDVFIPLIFVAALCCMGLAISLFCIRAKSKSKATWDPPAGVIFGKTTLKREDPQGSSNKMESVGHDLATDEQCRDGEDQQSLKHSSRSLQADDDVWVVPYDDGMSIGQSPNHLRTQFEDTKL